MENSQKSKSKIGKIFSVVVTAIIIILIAFAIIGSKGIGGYRYLNVLSGSMKPTLPIGSLVIIKDTPKDKLKIGDIITYETINEKGKKSGTYVTHRIVEVNEDDNFITQGDNNNTEDAAAVKESQIIGKVLFKINYLGKLFTFLREHIILTMLVFGIILFIPDIYRKIRK